jgi:D-aminoacyl-tRNA deacylase
METNNPPAAQTVDNPALAPVEVKTVIEDAAPIVSVAEAPLEPAPITIEKKEQEKIALVYSTKDPAGELIFQKIKEIGVPTWAKVYEFHDDIIFVKPMKIKEEKIIFLSKHSSEAGTKSLTVHMIGNFGDAKYGGKSRELSGALAWIGANYLRSLADKNISSGLNKQGFVVSYEATHHGPFTNKRCVFIELGSSPTDWKNELGAKVIAETVVESTLDRVGDKIVIGIGGGHYAPDFTKLTLRERYAFGHICPKHHLENLNYALFSQMIRKSRASEIMLDWKGLKEHKEKILKLAKKSGLPVERVQNLLK